MRLSVSLFVALALAAPGSAWAADCENSPYNCKVPNEETPPETKDRNRKYNDFDKTYYWGLLNQPELKDGHGGVRGHVKGDTKINFGQRKMINGVMHVYAFAAGLIEGSAASGWIVESSVYRQNTLAKMPTSSPGKPDNGFYQTDWVVTGGDLNAAGGLVLNEKYGNRKVNPNVPADEHEAASDYLVRQWNPATKVGYINFLYNLPGVGGMTTDTLPMCVHFKRFKDVPELEIELYFADSSSKSDLSLHFDFGEIEGRRGWITKEMLTPADELSKLADGHPCKPVNPPGPGAGGSGGSPDPGTGGSDPGTSGSGGSDPGAGGSDPGAGGSDPGAGGSDPGAGGAGGSDPGTSGAGGSEPGAGGASAGGSSQGGSGGGQGGQPAAGQPGSSGQGGAAAGSAQGSAGKTAGGSAGTKSSTGGAGGAGPSDAPQSDGEASSDGGCALAPRAARPGAGLLGLALGLGLGLRRRRRGG